MPEKWRRTQTDSFKRQQSSLIEIDQTEPQQKSNRNKEKSRFASVLQYPKQLWSLDRKQFDSQIEHEGGCAGVEPETYVEENRNIILPA